MRPVVSIVIPSYNRARDLNRALRSVLAQTFPRWEALIIDNHSNDNTDDLVKNFDDPRIKLFKIHNHGMIAASRNLGIKYAQGEYIAFLDSDDWWMPNKLDESLKYLESGADVVYHDLYIAKKINQFFYIKRAATRDLKSPVAGDLIANGNALANSSVVMKKDILLKMGLISEDIAMNPWCDFSAWLKVAKYTENFKRIPKTLGYYWMGGGNITSPKTTISVIERFISLYSGDINNEASDKIFWINYANGRAHYCLESYEMAAKILGLISWRNAPLTVCLKSYWLQLLIRLRRRSK